MTRYFPLISIATLAAACGGSHPAPPPNADSSTPPVAASPHRTGETPPDSLVLTTPAGYQIWFTSARLAVDAKGQTCVERGVEVRIDTTRTVVPLLFTNRPPRLVDPGHVRAVLMRNCAVVATYSVDLATGRPTKISDR
jgi:hypothetical protein